MLELHKDKIPRKLLKFFEPAKCGVCYVCRMVDIFAEVKRVLKDDGTLWLNLGDSYWGGKGSNANLDKGIENRIAEGRTIQRPQTRIQNMKVIPTNNKHESIKSKDLVGIPWMVAFAFRADGWYLRQDIIWHKPNPMPESVTDRCTKAHEYIFLMSKSARYYFDGEAIKEPANYDGRKDTMNKGSEKYRNGFVPNQNPQSVAVKGHERWQRGENGEYLRNKRSVWTVTTKPFKGAHFATFPEDLILPCILAGCPKDGTVLDPFAGAGTTGVVCKKNNRNFIGIELNPEYVKMAEQRIDNTNGVLF